MGLRTILFLINKHAKIYIIGGVKKFFKKMLIMFFIPITWFSLLNS